MDLSSDHPAFEATQGLRGVCALDPDLAAAGREMVQAEGAKDAERIEEVRRRINAADGEAVEWWRAAVALADHPGEELFSFDLTERKYWHALTLDEQQGVVGSGVAFLRQWTPKVDEWVGLESKPLDLVLPDWSGAHLILTLASHRPDLLRNLPDGDWQKWAPAMVRAVLRDGARGAFQKVREIAPEAGQAAIDLAVIDLARDTSSTTLVHPLAELGNPRFVEVIASIALADDLPVDRRKQAMGVLEKNHPEKALELAERMPRLSGEPWLASRVLAALKPDILVGAWLGAGAITEPQALVDLQVTELALELLQPFAGLLFEESQVPQDDEESPFSSVGSVLHRVLQCLAEAGMTSSLESLLSGRSPEEADYLRHFMQDSRIRAAELAHGPITPTDLIRLASDADARIVRDEAGLAAALMEELDRIQRYLVDQDGFKEIWNGYPGQANAAPEAEDIISDWLVRRINERLKPHLVADRELQATHHKGAGTGRRMDITVTRTGSGTEARVIFEAKRVEHPDLMTALRNQLVDQYLKPLGLSRGIYIVYWVNATKRPETWKSTHDDRAALRVRLEAQAAQLASQATVDVYVLDISGPD
ncbi:hypothetical protein [Kribbella solani]|uniref:Uncharacterized protein n=1 Tax=Kribbella solani TaxID=236067 RepID=A0A841DP89_9ACTN|nr:hypothetical protein [Kribbella solani]MBB5980924.1 hypothetical protein [Kribbella solani]